MEERMRMIVWNWWSNAGNGLAVLFLLLSMGAAGAEESVLEHGGTNVEVGVEIEADEPETDPSKPAYEKVQLLAEILLQVRRNYIVEKTYDELFDAAIGGMLASLDEHSAFLQSDALTSIQDDTEGMYVGIGSHDPLSD